MERVGSRGTPQSRILNALPLMPCIKGTVKKESKLQERKKKNILPAVAF